MKEAAVILADGFEECEALCVYDTLVRGGVKTVFLSVGESTVVSSHGVKITADGILSEKTLERRWNLVFLPGGMPGAANLAKSTLLKKMLVSSNERASLIGAICASPAVVLGPFGLLEGRKATVFPGCESFYPEFPFSTDGVVVSGNVVTAKSAGYAFDIGIVLLSLLVDEETADKVKSQIYYKEGCRI